MEYLNDAPNTVRVIFCGKGHFSSAFEYTRDELLPRDGIEVIEVARDELPNAVEDADVLVPLMSKLTADLLSRCKKLKLINQFGVGLEGVDLQKASAMGVPVCKIPSDETGNAQSCAEMCVLLCLTLLRQMPALQSSVRSGKLGVPTTGTLFKANVLIYGFGGIGLQLALRLQNFGCSAIRAVSRSGKVPFANKEDNEKTVDELTIEKMLAEGIVDLGTTEAQYHEFAATTDVVFLCLPQTADNMEFVDEKFIRALKKGAIIINVSRGGLVNYEDVVKCLNDAHLSGFGTDVFKNEPFPRPPLNDSDEVDPLWEEHKAFLEHPRVVCTPHVAGVTRVSYKRMATLMAQNILNIVAEKDVEGKVN